MATEAGRHAGGWILVVDDEPDIRDILRMVLEDHGISTEGATDGLQALEVLRDRPPPDLVILDLMMPRMDGWQLRGALLDDPRTAEIPVLILSGDGRVKEKANSLRAAGFIRKPVDLDVLLANVARHRSRPR